MPAAKRVHVCRTGSNSGIAAYARDFQDLVLKPAGYSLAEPASVLEHLAAFDPSTRFHIQLGVFQYPERECMSALMAAGYSQIEATIHDPPFVSFPFFPFRSTLMTRAARAFDRYLPSISPQRRALERLSRVFVLSEAGRRSVLALAPRANVVVIPHIVRPDSIWGPDSVLGTDLIYFGFIGPGKGLEYALELHSKLLSIRPSTHLHVVGAPNGRSGETYLNALKAKYRNKVTFYGYVPDGELDALFERASHVLLPYANYKHVVPASGSIVHAMRRGRIVWTTDVNAVAEVVGDFDNGFILTMDVEADVERLSTVMRDSQVSRRVSDAARRTATEMANYRYREHFQSGGSGPIS